MFKKFLNSLKNDNNASLIEAIQKGYTACFEGTYGSVVEYFIQDPNNPTAKKPVIGLSKQLMNIPLKESNVNEAKKQIIETWISKMRSNTPPNPKELELLASDKPIAKIDNDYTVILDGDEWNNIKKTAELVFGSEMKEIRDRIHNESQATGRNRIYSMQNASIKEEQPLINPNLFAEQERMKQARIKKYNDDFIRSQQKL